MIQSILLYLLGFLTAGLLALAIAPTVWRRAVRMTQRRIEASMPLSPADLQAQKDRQRAEHAMEIRRLEMTVKTLREKGSSHAVEIARERQVAGGIAAERDEKHKAANESDRRVSEIGEELDRHREEVARLMEKLAEAESKALQRAAELDKLEQLYDDASFASSSRQIELVARESEAEKLNYEIDELKQQLGELKAQTGRLPELDASIAEAATERERLISETGEERERHREEVARLMEKLAEAESKALQRTVDVARLEQLYDDANFASSSRQIELVAREAEVEKLNDEIGELKHQFGELKAQTARLPELDGRIAEAAVERERLEDRLTSLTRENRKLREQLGATGQAELVASEARLREQMSDLAAQVIHMTAMVDGPGSPIDRILAAAPDGGKVSPSLADRVRALRAASQPGEAMQRDG